MAEQLGVQAPNASQPYALPLPRRDVKKPKITSAQMDALRDKDAEMVKGIFHFHEVPGGVMEFVYKAYKGNEVEKYTMYDGHVYTIPLGVAKHLNKNLWYPVHSFMSDENGNSRVRIQEKVRRCSFQSIEFVDIDDLTPIGSNVVTAQFA